MPKAITIKEFEERKNEKFPQFKTIEFKNMTSPYKFFCEKHGEQISDCCYTFLNSKCGCSECFRELKSKNNKITIPKRVKYDNDELKEKLIKLNGNKYNYLFPEYNVGNRGRIKVFCRKHNFEFEAIINNLLTGQRCRLCANEKHNEVITKTKEKFLEECIEKFGDMYEYNLENYKTGMSYIDVKCKKCGSIRNIIAKAFLGGAGICPVCDESEGEFKVRSILTKYNINFKQHCYDFKNCKYKNTLEFDFYLPEHNLVIEVQGEQHYIDNGWKSGKEFKEQQIRDQIKREYCKNNNIKELEIPYWEVSKAEDILKEELIIE